MSTECLSESSRSRSPPFFLELMPTTFWKVWYVDPESDREIAPATHVLQVDAEAHVARLLQRVTDNVGEYPWDQFPKPSREEEETYLGEAVIAAFETSNLLKLNDVWGAFHRWARFVDEQHEIGPLFGAVSVERLS